MIGKIVTSNIQDGLKITNKVHTSPIERLLLMEIFLSEQSISAIFVYR